MTPLGIEPAAFWLAAQCLNQPPFVHKIFGPYHDVITEFNCTSATYSEIYQLSANATSKKCDCSEFLAGRLVTAMVDENGHLGAILMALYIAG